MCIIRFGQVSGEGAKLIHKPEWSGGDREEAPMRGFLSIVVAALLGTGSSVYGHETTSPLCGNRDEIVRSLAEQFKERQEAVGVVDQHAILEIFISPSATWTIIATGTDGKSCLVSSGEGWESRSLVPGFDS